MIEEEADINYDDTVDGALPLSKDNQSVIINEDVPDSLAMPSLGMY